jgi:hypothetical protein
MSVVTELIRTEENKSISFGNYELEAKAKLDHYAVGGDLYKVKTFREITKLERNGMFVYESVPGTAVHHFAADENGVSFLVEAARDCQITLELEENQEYSVTVDGAMVGQYRTNMGGKLSISLEMDNGAGKTVRIQK